MQPVDCAQETAHTSQFRLRSKNTRSPLERNYTPGGHSGADTATAIVPAVSQQAAPGLPPCLRPAQSCRRRSRFLAAGQLRPDHGSPAALARQWWMPSQARESRRVPTPSGAMRHLAGGDAPVMQLAMTYSPTESMRRPSPPVRDEHPDSAKAVLCTRTGGIPPQIAAKRGTPPHP